MQKVTFILIALAIISFGCNRPAASNEDSPIGAYKRLYAAVKAKNTDDIKAVVSKKSLDLAKFQASQQKKPIEQVLENGFTATTFAPSLPQIRDERIDRDMGAVEVYNIKESKWEDLPFVREDGAWKLAVGDVFAGTWKSPGKSISEKEREAANAAGNNLVPQNPNINGNFNTAPRPMVPKPATNMK